MNISCGARDFTQLTRPGMAKTFERRTNTFGATRCCFCLGFVCVINTELGPSCSKWSRYAGRQFVRNARQGCRTVLANGSQTVLIDMALSAETWQDRRVENTMWLNCLSTTGARAERNKYMRVDETPRLPCVCIALLPLKLYLKVGALGEDSLEGAFTLCPQVVAAIVVDHARLGWKGRTVS